MRGGGGQTSMAKMNEKKQLRTIHGLVLSALDLKFNPVA